jgi:hypothetical protein
MYYGGKSVAETLAEGGQQESQHVPVTEETPIFRHIDIRNVICHNAGYAMEFNGLPEMPINGIRLQNIHIQAKADAVFNNCQDIKQRNVHITVK